MMMRQAARAKSADLGIATGDQLAREPLRRLPFERVDLDAASGLAAPACKAAEQRLALSHADHAEARKPPIQLRI